ncbi:MAG: family 10 glycosylhydrolase [Pricia sp.]|nr:family 10 glycosylhydrolase [Pricia sp.]
MLKKFGFLLLISLGSCTLIKPIPQPKREFRGFWVATVVNIDWPKNGNDAIEKQKVDYINILDFYESLNFNAAIVQIRTAGDAFYDSKYAPWSRFLTGTEGNSPKTEESLLKWMIDETHKRGMEFHAWLNPYRATFDLKTEILSPTHDYYSHPEWMLKYGTKYYYDPGNPEVRKRMVSVIDEIVSNFDIDAIHFDDYFYPYKVKNEQFNDSLTYSYYALPEQSLEDWRRSNIDSLVKNSHEIIKKRKSWVQFGISPFGVWKNNDTDQRGSDTRAGQTTYDDLYADPLLWMEEGWLDYIVPQVYWSMDLAVASHRKIVDWWSNNSKNTNLYIGNGAYKVRNNADKAWDKKRELPDQLKLARETEAVQGNVFFSAKSLMQSNRDIVRHLKRRYYKTYALPPISNLAKANEKVPIQLKSTLYKNDSIHLYFNDLNFYSIAMVYPSIKKSKKEFDLKKLLRKAIVKNGSQISLDASIIPKNKAISIIFIDKYGYESEPQPIYLNQTNLND